MEQLTKAQEIALTYSACMDSVNLINGGQTEQYKDAEWAECLARNKEHLRLMLAKDFWTTEDLEPLRAASA
jgi:hypothetical protein